MKNKKALLPILILSAAILATAASAVISNIAKKPVVTEGEFPFSITYELDGETVTIEEVYKVRYVGNDGYADTKMRVYVGEIGEKGEDQTIYTLKKDAAGRIELWTYFYPDYMMGDPEYDYFEEEENEAFEPRIYYYDAEETFYEDEETLAAQGVKLISYEYPTPLKNRFVFSHISHSSGAVVFPTVLIGLLALLAMVIFVKRDAERKYKAIDIVSIVFGYMIGTVYLLAVIMLALLIDIEGGGPEFYYQAAHYIPAFSVLCLVASAALRRRGHGVSSLIVELIGPAAFAVYLVFALNTL